MRKLEDRCAINIRELRSAYSSPRYEYCRLECSGYIDILPCLLGKYIPLGESRIPYRIVDNLLSLIKERENK